MRYNTRHFGIAPLIRFLIMFGKKNSRNKEQHFTIPEIPN